MGGVPAIGPAPLDASRRCGSTARGQAVTRHVPRFGVPASCRDLRGDGALISLSFSRDVSIGLRPGEYRGSSRRRSWIDTSSLICGGRVRQSPTVPTPAQAPRTATGGVPVPGMLALLVSGVVVIALPAAAALNSVKDR